MSSPLIYLILGPTGAGRREVLVDLFTNGLEPTDRPVLLTAESETAAPSEIETRLAGVATLTRGTWTFVDGRFAADLPPEATHVFILTDGRANPVDQLEAIQLWLPASGGEIARILTVVNCRLGHAHPELLRWYDACVHFSDVVLLNRREDVPNKWISDFIARYRKQHLPCLIEMVKRGTVANPLLILEPQARRVSQLFDETDALSVEIVITDEDEDADDVDEDGEVVDEDAVPVDPYIERQAGSGRREKEIPEIGKFL